MQEEVTNERMMPGRRMSELTLPSPKFDCNGGVCPLDLSNDSDVHYNKLGLPYRRIGGSAYPPFFNRSDVDRLQNEWPARQDDVFLVFPAEPLSDAFQNFSVALVEQAELASVNRHFPRWLDAAVSRRGWKYLDLIDSWPQRRCLTTKSPPWQFPTSSFHYDPCERFSKKNTNPTGADENMPKVAVFASDPRVMVMREWKTAKVFTHKFGGQNHRQDIEPEFVEMLDAIVGNDCRDTNGLGVFGNSLWTLAAWARAESMFPENVRIFFMEDFVLQPEVAMRGLAKYLNVPSMSQATEMLIQESGRFAGTHAVRPLHEPSACSYLTITERDLQIAMEDYVVDFERQLAEAPDRIQQGWEQLLAVWGQSASTKLNEYARVCLRHERWDPPKWWASHNARMCRPCLYFPRGKCVDDNCGYCHGDSHPKPKRPAKNKRASQRRRFDRTPSPDAETRMTQRDSDELPSGGSRSSSKSEPRVQLEAQIQAQAPYLVQPAFQYVAVASDAGFVQPQVQMYTPVVVWTQPIAQN